MEKSEKVMRLTGRNLRFTYPGSEKPVLENLDFSMTGPGFNAIFGPSGVGKTSLARLLAGKRGRKMDAILYQSIQEILYTYNKERLPGWSNTGSHLDKVCPSGKEELMAEMIDIFQVRPVLNSRFSQLSMGQQNRMNLLRYLVQDFNLLIMDESLANVDEALREVIILAIKDFFPAKFFLSISHNLMAVARFCREILVLRGGPGGALIVRGQDQVQGSVPGTRAMNSTMLEIMNAV